jgi:hypothetical protein
MKKKVAERTGLEPATPGVTGRYSNRLNYRSALEGRHFTAFLRFVKQIITNSLVEYPPLTLMESNSAMAGARLFVRNEEESCIDIFHDGL